MSNRCSGCSKYIQHYAFLEGAFRPVFCGHCTQRRKRSVNQHSLACERFVPGDRVEEQLVTKKYLTKALLEKVLTMELWPEEKE